MAVEDAQRAGAAPGPFFQLRDARGFPHAHTGMELRGLALLTAYRHGTNPVSRGKP